MSKTRRDVSIEWWGTAAFRIKYGDWTALLDPYVTRNPHADPHVPVSLAQAAQADHALISHGHFDHVQDLPAMLKLNPKLKIWGPTTAMNTVRRYTDTRSRVHAVNDGVISLGTTRKVLENGEVKVEAFQSKHVHFDAQLVTSTLSRIIRSSSSRKYITAGLLTQYPCGETISWVINMGGFRVRFLGSAGPGTDMLRGWARTPDDCLLVPLQGNSKICQIGAKIVEELRPRYVIPHHHDNFYPPLSQTIDIEPFKALVRKKSPSTQIIELDVCKPHVFVDAGTAVPERKGPEWKFSTPYGSSSTGEPTGVSPV